METVILIVLAAVLALQAAVLIVLLRRRGDTGGEALKEALRQEAQAARADTLQTVQTSVAGLGEVLAQSQRQFTAVLNERLGDLNTQLTLRQESLQQSVDRSVRGTDARMAEFTRQSAQQMEQMRATLQNRVSAMQEDNARQLDRIRLTVDEKLQKTLDERLGQSFKVVSERLEQVYKGLGEMQTLAVGVGDLKKVLSNVKTRGILGEIQLGAILEQILAPEQYGQNVCTKPGSKNVVEFAVKLPGDGEEPVWLPVDAKFPADAYAQLMDAYDRGDPAEIEQLGAALERRVKQFAKDIRDKYIAPPYTTDFGILFLPVEGLYAEVVRRGLVETLQNEYKISLAGPTTMAAMLNSLQMGFRTLAIQKRSGEVWQVLGAVKTEFGKFEGALSAAQQRLEQAGSELDRLVGVRTRQIQRRLKEVSQLPEEEAGEVLGLPEA
ncbi:DNA recombination protein RmuC [Bittarella massiliensis]|nr:DNA recombination protein RmuC [Bittarella massiliensis (ex Durand et al. 2017)]MBO1678366.1 DNA recombination protein RmuC [Bittarella massiliensis (ex Durand et al. 2017)]